MARLLQIRLLRRTYRDIPVFLDSDHLVDLDFLFHVVRSCTYNLVLMLTRETLDRPWVVGEVVTAVQNVVPIIGVQFPSFQMPTISEVQDFDHAVCGLARYEITMPMVVRSVCAALALDRIGVPPALGDDHWDTPARHPMPAVNS